MIMNLTLEFISSTSEKSFNALDVICMSHVIV